MKNRTRKYDFFVILTYILAITLTLLHDKSLEHIFGISFFFHCFCYLSEKGTRQKYQNGFSISRFHIYSSCCLLSASVLLFVYTFNDSSLVQV